MAHTTPRTDLEPIAPVQRQKPVLAYSADRNRADVDQWMRQHHLWRTTLYHFLARNPRLALVINQDALTANATGRGGLGASLRKTSGRWIVSAGMIETTFDDAEPAVGIFCAAVVGDARVKIIRRNSEIVRATLELRGEPGAWIESIVQDHSQSAPLDRDTVHIYCNFH